MKKLSLIILLTFILSNCKEDRQTQINKCLGAGGFWDNDLERCIFDFGSFTANELEQNSIPSNNISFKNGLIVSPKRKKWEPCCLHIPKSGLQLYDKSNGDLIAKLQLIESDNNSEFYESRILYNNGNTEKFGFDNFYMIGYEIFALKFEDNENGYIQLVNEMWVKISELVSNNLILQSWMDYAINQEEVLGWYGNNQGLSLRIEPNEESEQIQILKGDLFEIKLSKETKGNWVKVSVSKYKIHPCNDPRSKPIKQYHGWIELISTNGTLNVWSYGKGC